MDDLHRLAAQHRDLLTLLDRDAALRDALELVTSDGQIAWIGEPDGAGTVMLRHTRGDLTGQLRNLRVPSGLGLTGKVHQSALPSWVDDYFRASTITHTFDEQIQAERVTRLLAVPVVWDDQVLGVLAVGARDDGVFGDRAVARANDVADRVALAVAVAERARLAREVAVYEERSRLAAQLHDTVGALLFAIGSSVTGLTETAEGDPELAAGLERLRQQTAQASMALRDSLRALHASPSALALSVTLQGDCAAFSDRTGVPAELIILDDPPDLPPSRTEVLVAAVREALLNIEKHAQASAVVVTISRHQAGGITVAVTDDGTGLPTAHAPGLGLTTTGDAVARVGGALHLSSDPQGGTMVRIELPC
ncbi:GAF domain-containing sensor histidine kinase [Amycolatopsis acididurans]|nr:ATP-binding protein [Amycolatopsis acididurans]